MGSTYATADDLAARAAYRAASGTTYAHTAATRAAAPADRKIHESLDPKRLNTLGVKVRECLDSPEHPLTIPVVVAFDETGSMGQGPIVIQQKLASLKGLTLRSGLIDAQLCFGAYGDAECYEVAPCQIGQFESGLEMEEWLNNLYLEGLGGGNGGETAGLLMYFLANYSKLDSLDKRGKKGYLFLTGDETSLPVTKKMVLDYIGEGIEADLSMEEVVRQCSESYEIFFFLVMNGAARTQGSLNFWTKLLGQDHVVQVENLDNIAELTAALLAAEEGVVLTPDMMKAEGVAGTSIEVVNKTLANYAGGTKATVAVATSGTVAGAATTAADRL